MKIMGRGRVLLEDFNILENIYTHLKGKEILSV